MMERVGNIVLLEHLYLPTSDYLAFSEFCTEALKLTLDPFKSDKLRENNAVWINAGYQQLHLPKKPSSQSLGGHIGIIVPSIEDVQRSLQYYEKDKQTKGIDFEWRLSHLSHSYFPTPVEGKGKDKHKQKDLVLEVKEKQASNGFFIRFYQNNSALSFRGDLGVSYLEFRCPIGSVEKIAKWYEVYFKSWTSIEEDDEGDDENPDWGSKERGDTARKARICAGPSQWIIFRESRDFTYDGGYHFCIYITDFDLAYKRFAKDGLLYNSHPFSDHARSLDEALIYHQFRVKDITEVITDDVSDTNGHSNGHTNGVYTNGHTNGHATNGHTNGHDNKTGTKIIMKLEHEVRSMYHPNYMRPLVNRTGSNGLHCTM